MGFSLGNPLSFVSDGLSNTISTGTAAGKSLYDSAVSGAKTGAIAAKDGLYSAANNAKELASNAKDKANESLVKGADWYKQNEGINVENLFTPDGVQSVNDKVGTINGENQLTLFSYSTFDPNASLKGGQKDKDIKYAATHGRRIAYTQDAQPAIYTTDDGNKITLGTAETGGGRPYSVFNKYSLVNFRGTPFIEEGGAGQGKSKQYHKVNIDTLVNPSASKIIEVTGSYPGNVGYRYNYADFAMAKDFGKRANNMMITLRRFAYPCPDDIISPKALDDKGKETSLPQPDIARAITWMGPDTGNELGEILKFSHGFNWKSAESQFQTIQRREARAGSFGAAINNSSLLSSLGSAAAGESSYEAAVRRANGGFDAFSETYPNHVFGPLNVIKNVMIREQGLTFDNEFTLTFEYKLKELGGANSKILMLDQLSNMLALTYNNAPFWGGDYRFVSTGKIGKPLGDIKYIKSGQHFKFISSVIKDFGKQYPGAKSAANTGGDIMSKLFNGDFKGAAEAFGDINIGAAAGKALERTLGGSLMKLFNTPQGGYAINALLTGDPTGQWHVTIGNPLNPMMVMGNLICTNTEVHFDGAIGPNDFPEKMKVTISLKPGMPRDKAGIESMFNSGRGRFYIQPDGIADINNTFDISAYGNKDNGSKFPRNGRYVNTFRKLGNG